MLNNCSGPSAVCARAYPFFDGALSSATTFQTLPSPLPVLAEVQPLGSLPASPLANVNVSASCAAAGAQAASKATVTAAQRVIGRSSGQAVANSLVRNSCDI